MPRLRVTIHIWMQKIVFLRYGTSHPYQSSGLNTILHVSWEKEDDTSGIFKPNARESFLSELRKKDYRL